MWDTVLLFLILVCVLCVLVVPLMTAFAEIRQTGKASFDSNHLVGLIWAFVGVMCAAVFIVETFRTGGFMPFVGALAASALMVIALWLPHDFKIRKDNEKG